MAKTQPRKIANHARRRLFVVPGASGWMVEDAASKATRRYYDTQREALAAARKLVKHADGGEVIVRRRDGRIRAVDTFALSGGAVEKINAIEGVFLTEEMKRDLRALRRKRLSADERRRWLTEKYGK